MPAQAVETLENVLIVGFDLGHGDTALASSRFASTDEPKPMPVNGERVIPTLVSRLKDGRVLVGAAAVQSSEPSVQSFERFKTPRLVEGDQPTGGANATRMFVEAIFSALKADRQIEDLNKTRVFVGHPSGWPQASVDAYRDLFARSGLPFVVMVPESRAAFVHARESRELHVTMDELSRRVLIMDFGSSTADFTATVGLATQPLDFGDVSLGAGIIDGLIMERMVATSDKASELRDALEQLPGKRVHFAHKCRLAKESYFNREKVEKNPRVQEAVMIAPRLYVEIDLDRLCMESLLTAPSEMLRGSSWRRALDNCLAEAKRKFPDPDLVMLTGGAARMGFVRGSVVSVFNDIRVSMSQEPEFSVAKGLALFGRLSLKSESFRSEIDRLIDGEKFRKVILDGMPALVAAQSQAVGEALANGPVRTAIRLWRSNLSTIDDMGKEIADDCRAWVRGPDALLTSTRVTAEWLEGLRIKLEMLTDPICERYAIPKRALSLSGYGLPSASGRNIGTPDVIGDTSVVQTIAAVIATAVMAKILIALHLLLAAHPIGWAIALVGAVISAIVGVDAAKDALKATRIPRWARSLLVSDSKLDSMIAEATTNIASQIRTELMKSEETAPPEDKLATRLCAQIGEALRKRADDAILLLK
jgi:hypothetical protein